MATFDQLSDQQRAIVELVLQQGKSYDQLADMLGMPERRVRELARDALVELAPISARRVEEDWRGQLADYVLGQQAGPEATATRGHLRRSEPARSWTRSLLDSLEQLYTNGDLPAIPDGERGSRRGASPPPAEPAAAAGTGEDSGRGPLGPTAIAAVRRRRVLAAAAGVVAVLLVVLVWPVGLLTGDDSSSAGGQGSEQAASKKPKGGAVIARQNGKDQILVTAQDLKPSTQSSAYQVWLYDSDARRKSLGATATDPQGRLQVLGNLPAGYRAYKFIDVTPVTVKGKGKDRTVENGASVLRGLLEFSKQPIKTGSGNQQALVLANIRLLPLPQSSG